MLALLEEHLAPERVVDSVVALIAAPLLSLEDSDALIHIGALIEGAGHGIV